MAQVAFNGNIGKVFDVAFGQDGKARLNFTVAEGHSKFNKQSNEWEKTGTTWRRVTVFGKKAETLSEILREGAKQRVLVMGKEETRHWEKDGREGDNLEVVADEVALIPANPQNSQQPQQSGGLGQPAQQPAQGWGGAPAQSQPPASGWGDFPSEPAF